MRLVFNNHELSLYGRMINETRCCVCGLSSWGCWGKKDRRSDTFIVKCVECGWVFDELDNEILSAIKEALL